MTNASITLTEEQIDELGRELDALKLRVINDLGKEDLDYIYKVIKAQRALEVGGRASLYLGFLPPFWLLGTACLGVSKILDNMEIGHNVMHGQYDWTRDPALNSKRFEWDTACPSDQWRHSHNYMHHTFTKSGASAPNTGVSLLEQAEAAGQSPEYGCRMGICFSCTQVKTTGCTRNIRTGELNSDPDTEIQLCVNVPVGDVAIEI